jgi:hypothetical protein
MYKVRRKKMTAARGKTAVHSCLVQRRKTRSGAAGHVSKTRASMCRSKMPPQMCFYSDHYGGAVAAHTNVGYGLTDDDLNCLTRMILLKPHIDSITNNKASGRGRW